jgi:type I restriction enzyme M protein
MDIQIKSNKIITPVLNKWMALTPEEKVRQEFICRLVNTHGYQLNQAEILFEDKKSKKYIEESKLFSRDEFSKLLTRCHNIIRNNDKMSPEAAFDEISKVLFMKIMFERELKGALVFSKSEFHSQEENYERVIRPGLKKTASFLDKDYMQYLFEETKGIYEKDDIFEKGDQIRIKRNSFEMIVKELESFNLSNISDDVKGIAFEQFLGKTFRGELGQFFTPRTIVDFMVYILDPQEDETICDPCCGSGGFLITAFDYVRDKIDNDIQNQIKSIKESQHDFDDIQNAINKINEEFDITNPYSRYHKLSHNCIFGTDANPRMARTAKMNMIMHGDGHGGVHHHDGLLDVNGIFKNRFDIILTNPPFGARIEKSQVVSETDLPTKEQAERYAEKYPNYVNEVLNPLKEYVAYNKGKGKPILDLYQTGSMSTLTEVLFIERCLNLLKPGGRMGIVLPEGVLNNTNLQKVREFVESHAKILLIVSIPQDVFIASGATVKPSLLFLKKFTEVEAEQYDIIKANAEKEVTKNYKNKLEDIDKQLSEKGRTANEKKALKIKRKEIEYQIITEVKELVKTQFNYDVPLAEVEKAGISTTGAVIENELKPLETEYTAYRKANNLWNNK